MRKIILCDLDGTLNTNNRRGEYIPANDKSNEAWLPWHKAFEREILNESLIETLNSLQKIGYELVLVTNRDHSVKEKTIEYLKRNGLNTKGIIGFFRDSNEETQSATVWKASMLSTLLRILETDTHVIWFDDDKKAFKLVGNFHKVTLTKIYINFKGN